VADAAAVSGAVDSAEASVDSAAATVEVAAPVEAGRLTL
jgi:hypothetical protein